MKILFILHTQRERDEITHAKQLSEADNFVFWRDSNFFHSDKRGKQKRKMFYETNFKLLCWWWFS